MYSLLLHKYSTYTRRSCLVKKKNGGNKSSDTVPHSISRNWMKWLRQTLKRREFFMLENPPPGYAELLTADVVTHRGICPSQIRYLPLPVFLSLRGISIKNVLIYFLYCKRRKKTLLCRYTGTSSGKSQSGVKIWISCSLPDVCTVLQRLFFKCSVNFTNSYLKGLSHAIFGGLFLPARIAFHTKTYWNLPKNLCRYTFLQNVAGCSYFKLENR